MGWLHVDDTVIPIAQSSCLKRTKRADLPIIVQCLQAQQESVIGLCWNDMNQSKSVLLPYKGVVISHVKHVGNDITDLIVGRIVNISHGTRMIFCARLQYWIVTTMSIDELIIQWTTHLVNIGIDCIIFPSNKMGDDILLPQEICDRYVHHRMFLDDCIEIESSPSWIEQDMHF